MGDIAREYLQVKVLRTFEPLNSLGADKLEELANKSQVEELPAGRTVFRQGEKDKRCVYLLSGTLELQITGNPNTELVKAKTLEAKYPIAQEIPRPSTCRTKTNAVLLYIDSDLLEFLMDDSPSGLYEVTEIRVDEDPESDWMLRFLQSPAFLRLPTEKIQRLLMKFQEIPVQKGQVIIKQGDTDPWYYIVKEGQCIVSRRPAPAAEEVRLAILGPGDGFGEEALITHGKRNATISMKDAGVLMRLAKQDFTDLLVTPLLQKVDHQTMMDKVRAGAAIIDVRTNKEFNENGIKGAQNIPLSMLRLKAQSLNPTREHIIYCNDGGQSAAAAFLLAQHGVACFVLANGINAQSKPFGAATPAPEPVIEPATQPVAKSHLIPSAPARMSPGSTATNTPAYVATGEFELHRYQAKTQADRANEAEKAHKNFSSRTLQLRSEADALRSQAQRLAEKTSAAENERKKAEAEIQRLQAEAAKQREEMLSTAKLAIAKEKERAQQEAARLKAEAEQARKRADEEANRIRREAQEVAERQARLEAEFKNAEEQKRKSAHAAEEARRAAKQEAERVKLEAAQIRQRAMDEARQLRESLEAQRSRLVADDAAKRNAALDEAKRRAETAIQQAAQAAEESRRQAQLEADAIRRQALEEVQRMRIDAEREVKKSVLKRAEEQHRYEQELEQSRSLALEQVQRQAELEAEAIRRQAIDETEQLRAEIEATRRMIENETLLAKSRYAEEAQRQDDEDTYGRAAEEAAARAAADAARRAQEEARRRREEELRAAEQARRVTELARRAAEQEEQERQQREAEAAHQLALEEARRAETLRRAAELKSRADDKARQRAEVLKERLQAQDIARQQPDEFLTQTGVGMKLATAKLHVVKDKTILEGEQDIFIFKAPSHRPPSREEAEALIRQAENQMREQSRKELPTFDIDYADEPAKPTAKATTDKSGFSESVITDLNQLSAYNKPQNDDNELDFTLPPSEQPKPLKRSTSSRYRLYALAASVVVMIAVSIIAITRPTYMDANLVANITASPSQSEQRGLASMRTPAPALQTSPEQDIASDKATAENRVRNKAEEEFQSMLSRWRSEHQASAKPNAQ